MPLGYLYMLKMFNNYLCFLYIALTFMQIYKELYPIQHQNLLIKISYYAIYCYSKMQLVIQNSLLAKLICILFYNNYANNNVVEVIFEGVVINKINKNNIDYLMSANYDFILYSEIINNLTYKRIIYSDTLKLNDKNEGLFVCEPSEVKFVLTEIILEDKKININFKMNDDNYYVCDNIFNSKFIIYFLNKYYSEDIQNMSLDKYQIDILDQNVNKEIITSEKNIKINKTDYYIF
jgi:hypothetical protein